jgi:hypothetical protein
LVKLAQAVYCAHTNSSSTLEVPKSSLIFMMDDFEDDAPGDERDDIVKSVNDPNGDYRQRPPRSNRSPFNYCNRRSSGNSIRRTQPGKDNLRNPGETKQNSFFFSEVDTDRPRLDRNGKEML